MKSMKFNTADLKPNTKTIDIFQNDRTLKLLLDDPRSPEYAAFIGTKFQRTTSTTEIPKILKELKQRTFTDILFSENNRNKIVRYLSCLIIFNPRMIVAHNPFFYIDDTTMFNVVTDLNSYIYSVRDNKDTGISYVLNLCTTSAHIVQMLAKAGKYMHMVSLPENKLTSDIMQKMCSYYLQMYDKYTEGDSNFFDVILGSFSAFNFPKCKEETSSEIIISFYRYLITKFLRFYRIYFLIKLTVDCVEPDFISIFNHQHNIDPAKISFDFLNLSSDQLSLFIDNISLFILEERSLPFLLLSIEKILK